MSILQLKKWTETIPLSLSDSLCEKLETFTALLLKKNEEINLIGPADFPAFQMKHLVDSLAVVRYLEPESGLKVLDLGTGGGLPGIPLAMVFPELEFTLADSTEKKINAVSEFVKTLGLKNVTTVVGRAEELGHKPGFREAFDRVLSRAVAPLRVLAELAYPLVRLQGKLIAYKGPEYIHELLEARNALTSLEAPQPQVKLYSLPEGVGERAFIIVPKEHPTPVRYPRRNGVPAKRPL